MDAWVPRAPAVAGPWSRRVEAGRGRSEAAAVTAGSDGHRGRLPARWNAREPRVLGPQPLVPPEVRPVTRFFCTR